MRAALAVALLACAAVQSLRAADAPPRPSPGLDSRLGVLLPHGMSFAIPPAWLDSYRWHGGNLHMTRQALDEVRFGEGEWDAAFSRVVNALLPFDKCAFHGGGEGWSGRQAVSYGDLQMRVYIGGWEVRQLHDQVKSDGLEEARKLSTTRKATRGESVQGDWQVVSLAFPLFFQDYGATAQIDFYSQSREGTTVTLVFMYTSYPGSQKGQIRDVVESFRFPGAKPQNQDAPR